MFKIAIVGKQNVGKSTIFNKVLGRRHSITLDRKGVTKDVLQKTAVFKQKRFLILDTAGFHPEIKETIERATYALKDCNLVLFVVENTFNQEDKIFASWLRKNCHDKEILLVQNKIDRKEKEEVGIFGFKKSFFISAEHSVGLKELLFYITSKIEIEDEEDIQDDKSDKTDKGQIKIAILGRPNVGKSTLMNRLLKDNRSLVQDKAGTTVDPVTGSIQYSSVDFDISDTAGIRKKSKIEDQIESFASSKSFDAAKNADVCMFLFDAANLALEKQDFVIINKILDASRPVVLVANKIDKSNNKEEVMHFVKLQSNKLLLDKVSIFAISSLNDKSFDNIIDECKKIYLQTKKEIKIGQLNRWLASATSQHVHPVIRDKVVKFKYITKVKKRLVFVITCTKPKLAEASYVQYLKNSLAKNFGLESAPVKIKLKQS